MGRSSTHATTSPYRAVHLDDENNETSASHRSWAGKKKTGRLGSKAR